MLQLLLFQAFQALKQFKIIPSTHAHTSCCFFGCEITFSFELVLSFVGFTVAPRLKSVAAVASIAMAMLSESEETKAALLRQFVQLET